MSLVRVDDRLIHGQVVVGWVKALGAKRIVVVDDDVAESEWQRELYTLGTPPDVAVEFASLDDAPAAIARCGQSAEKSIILVANVRTAVRLCGSVSDITVLNLGGLHDGASRTKRLPYVYLSDEEAAQLLALRDRGIKITAQDVPTARSVALKDLL